MDQSQFGAHELLEMNEVLMDTINGINQFQLYIPFCKDQELLTITQNQIGFMGNEYNFMVNLLKSKGKGNSLTYRQVNDQATLLGLQGIMPQESPNQNTAQMNDQDIAYGMLGCAKSTASMRMKAALECADPDLRSMLIQGAKNSADQAYEIWLYMNNKRYYQVPTFSFDTAQQMIDHYTQISDFNNGQMNQ